MNRRSIIICTVIAVALMAGIGWLFCTLFFDSGEETVRTDRLTDGVEAVPSDAIFLFEAGSLSEIRNLTDEESALGRLAGCIPPAASGWEAALSMHYSSKNSVSPLLVLSIPDDVDAASFMDGILDKCRGIIDKRYGSVVVHKSAVPDASFAVYGKFLIASPSLVIVESSLRHLENGMSIKDEPMYDGITGVKSDCGVIHVNFANLGKLFSGAADRKHVGDAAFFQNFADWAAFGIGSTDGTLSAEGRSVCVRQDGKFSDVLRTQRGRKPQVYSVAPYGTSSLLSLPITDWKDFMDAYAVYVAARGKKKDYDYINAVASRNSGNDMTTAEFASSLGISEISVFSFDMGGASRVLAVKVGDTRAVGNVGDSVCKYRYAGYIPALLGEIFRPSSEEFCCVLDGWLLLGCEEELSYLRGGLKRGTMFSLQDYMEQTPAAEELRKISCLSMMVNTGKCADSIAALFREPYSRTMSRAFGRHNFELFCLNMYPEEQALGIRSTFYSEDLESLPQPGTVVAGVIVDDTPVQVPKGPFPVKNFIDGSTNYLEQLGNNSLRLLNSARKPVWTVSFKTPLCGTVRQIDYLKNNKLQMLFGSGNKVFLYDRLGRIVEDFPITLGKEILLGPDVYDFKGDKNYTMMVLHTDNTVAQYGIDGRKSGIWKDITSSERILALPEMIEVGGSVYWVVRTAYQTMIYDAGGTICADFSKKRKLRKDTVVEPVSGHEVSVTTADGREMILDLEDGSFRRK